MRVAVVLEHRFLHKADGTVWTDGPFGYSFFSRYLTVFDSVRVVFPDGAEHLAAPVINWDLMADLAVIGPIDSTADVATLVDGEDLTVGSDVFLIGYPGEVQEFPQPTITRGIISPPISVPSRLLDSATRSAEGSPPFSWMF